jgi:hypothetical protein
LIYCSRIGTSNPRTHLEQYTNYLSVLVDRREV